MRRNHHPAVATTCAYLAIAFLGLIVASSGIFQIAGAQSAGNAKLTLSPASGSYAVGGTFTVSVMLDSGGGVGVNAADGELSFDPTVLAVQGVSKDNSVFNLWTSNPSFSNAKGTVDYSGGSNDAYTGSAGDVLDVTFKVLAGGAATVKFASATALAADGAGDECSWWHDRCGLYGRRDWSFNFPNGITARTGFERQLFTILGRRRDFSSRSSRNTVYCHDRGHVTYASQSKPMV